MSRVEWSRLSGQDIETVIAIMLCREHPNANRPKPHQGDGGIDLLVQSADGAAIYQIKGYTGNLTSVQKSHIRKSWNALLEYSKAEPLKISEWNLVIPENLTNPQRKWVRELTKDASFTCHLHTLDWVEALTAKYPDVIDYYLRDGKDRLESAIKTYLSIIAPDTSTQPVESRQRIIALHRTLNDLDPHYRYDFSVDSVTPEQQCPTVSPLPRLVAAVQVNDGQSCITYRIFSRFDEALKERPIPGKFTLVAERGSELEAQLQDWAKFGTPLENFPARDISADLPGGFGTKVPSGFVSLRPAGPIPEAMAEITLSVIDVDGSTVESLDFITDEITTGYDRTGARGVGHERLASSVTYELKSSLKDQVNTIQLTLNDITGKRPGDILPGLRFIAAIKPSRKLQISVKDGPALAQNIIRNEILPDAEGNLMIAACEAIQEFQKVVFVKIAIPDLTMTSWETFESWITAAALLRGEEVTGTWNEVNIHLHPGTSPSSEVGALMSRGPWAVKVDDNTYPIGMVDVHLASAMRDSTRQPEQHDDHLDVWYVPAGSDAAIIRMVFQGELSTSA